MKLNLFNYVKIRYIFNHNRENKMHFVLSFPWCTEKNTEMGIRQGGEKGWTGNMLYGNREI